MRKYKYLNKEGEYHGDVVYQSRNVAKYVFQRSSLEIFYLGCDTIDEFYKYYSRKNPSSRMFYEVINDNFSAQKFKLDIDGRIGNVEMEYVLRTIRKTFRKLTKMVRPEASVYDISTSHHVIVTNVCFASASSCEMIANIVCEKVARKFPTAACLMDTGVYKRVQMFRIEGSTKYKQRRWKYLLGTKELSPLDIFKKGIVTYTDDCYLVDDERVIDVASDLGVYQLSTREQFEYAKKAPMKIPREFVLRKVVDKLIVLDRVEPSFCNTCNRVHERDNAYILGDKLFCLRNHSQH